MRKGSGACGRGCRGESGDLAAREKGTKSNFAEPFAFRHPGNSGASYEIERGLADASEAM